MYTKNVEKKQGQNCLEDRLLFSQSFYTKTLEIQNRLPSVLRLKKKQVGSQDVSNLRNVIREDTIRRVGGCSLEGQTLMLFVSQQ